MGQWSVYLFPALTVIALFAFAWYYVKSMRSQAGVLMTEGQPQPKRKLQFPKSRFPMERKDALPLLLLTVVYAVTAFWGLGDTKAPQQFCRFPRAEDVVELTLKRPTELGDVMYFCGLNTGTYTLSYTVDGTAWETAATLEQQYVDLFKWKTPELSAKAEGKQVIALRLEADCDGMELGELALFDGDHRLLTQDDFSELSETARHLLDDQEVIPEKQTYLNSTYFDEIYHARTALEHIRNMNPYEVSHPPLGKLILGLGIRLFGMTPFGWRFMGTLFGVLMLPILYVFFKNMFGKTPVAFCGTALFAFDFMHLTQTRIATIDTYAVFFILLMYYFMYRFLTTPTGTPFRKTAVPLFFSGLFFGIGAASKWTVIYAGAGLAALFFLSVWVRYRDAKAADQAQVRNTSTEEAAVPSVPEDGIGQQPGLSMAATTDVLPSAASEDWELSVLEHGDTAFWKELGMLDADDGKDMPQAHLQTMGAAESANMVQSEPELLLKEASDFAWVSEQIQETEETAAIPVPTAARRAYWSWLLKTLLLCVGCFIVIPAGIYCLSYLPYAAPRGEALNFKLIWDNQVFMFTYHKGVTQEHPYASKWWQWLFDLRPILYYLDANVGNGLKSAFGAFSNPVVCWGGLISMVLLVWRYLKTKAGTALLILIGYLSQLVFWIPIARPTFAYHYFPSILFLTFAMAYGFNEIWEAKQGKYQAAVFGMTGGAALLYAAFYPVLTGIAVPAWYGTNFLRWFPTWPF